MNEKDCLMLTYLEHEPNITQAAKRLFTTQPALAYRIKQIEEEFGIDLFYREGKTPTLTPEGRCLIHYAHKQLQLLRETKDQLRELANAGNLRIGVNSYVCNSLFPPLLSQFHRHHPEIQYYIHSGMSSEIFKKLQSGDINLAIVRGDFAWTGEKQLLHEDQIGIVSSSPITLASLPDEPRIFFQEPDYLSQIPNHTKITIEDMIKRWWAEHFTDEPKAFMKVDSYETCVRMVDAGLGYAIVPKLFLLQHAHLPFQPLHFQDGTVASRRMWVYYRENSLTLRAVETFLSFLLNYFAENIPGEKREEN